MFTPTTIKIVFLLSYALVVLATVTGLLKLILKDNELNKTLHKLTGPVVNIVFLIFFFIASLPKMAMLRKLIITVLFISIVYTGLVTGIRKDKPWMIRLHQGLGIFTFVLFTMLLFFFMMR